MSFFSLLPIFLLGFNPILIAIAVIPGIFLLRYIYKEDRLEKEPTGLIVKLVLLGAVSTALAVVGETVGAFVIKMFSGNYVLYRVLMYFVVVAFSEEGFKYLVLKKFTWKNPEFNCKFDGVVYAVSVSLGFAIWENIQYVLSYGLGTALLRAVTAVPGHACFGVIMGAWYGLAKKKEIQGWDSASRLARKLSVIIPAVVHGAYDYIATADTSSFNFFMFVILMFIVCFYTIKRLSADDSYLDSDDTVNY